jgi:hypothetical protein
MKNILKITILLALIQLGACSDDKDSGQDAQTKMLTAEPWSHAQVTHSDGDLSAQYEDFVIVFTSNSANGFDGTFIVSNGGYAFAETSGQWKFDDSKIILDSGKEMEFELTENSLQLDFTVAPSGGRVAGVSGHFTFDLRPL